MASGYIVQSTLRAIEKTQRGTIPLNLGESKTSISKLQALSGKASRWRVGESPFCIQLITLSLRYERRSMEITDAHYENSYFRNAKL